MPRRKDLRPTHIYWLVDIRPEALMAFGPNGQPFYCGKTVRPPEKRLQGHQNDIKRTFEHPRSVRLRQCAEHVRVTVLETVPACEDWCARETYWIALSRRLFPGIITNLTNGGEGPAGCIQSAETRAKIGNALRGRSISPEHRAKLCGQKRSPETCARISAVKLGKKRPKISAAKLGKKFSPEHCAKLSLAAKTRLRKPFSPETRARMSIAAKARCAR